MDTSNILTQAAAYTEGRETTPVGISTTENNSTIRNNKNSTINFQSSFDQYFLGGARSSKKHLSTLNKQITSRKQLSPRRVKDAATAITSKSLNNAMKMFKRQQKHLHSNAAKAVQEHSPVADPTDKQAQRTRQIIECYGLKNPLQPSPSSTIPNNADIEGTM